MYTVARFPGPIDPWNGSHHFIRTTSSGPDSLLQVKLTVGHVRLVLGETYSFADARRFADMAALRFKRYPKFNHSRRQAELDTEQVSEATNRLDEIAAVHLIPDGNLDIPTRLKLAEEQIKYLTERLNAIEGL